MKFLRTISCFIAAATLWLLSPGVSLACERCFGAGSDSPIVSAIGISMLGLLIMIGFVFGGIVSFFNQANRRARLLEAEKSDASSNE